MPRVTTAALASGVVLGVAARLHGRWGISRRVPRSCHQVAFTSSLVCLAADAWSHRRSDPFSAVADGAALLVLSSLPLTRAGRVDHVTVASVASTFHVLGLVTARSPRRR